MMRTTRMIRVALLAGFALGSPAWAQPTIPQEQIPADAPEDVKKEIAALYAPALVDRANAARRLGRMGEKASPAIPFLVSALGDTKSEVVQSSFGRIIVMGGQEASNALSRIGKPAVKPLSVALQNPNSTVRTQAARALGLMKTEESLTVLITALGRKDAEVRKAAAQSLEEATGQKLGESQAAWRKWLAANKDSLAKKQ